MKQYRNIRAVCGAAMVMLSVLGSARGGEHPGAEGARDAVTASAKVIQTKGTIRDARHASVAVASLR